MVQLYPLPASAKSGINGEIKLATALSEIEKTTAMAALQEMLASVVRGDVADFRMIIHGQQRTTHSDSEDIRPGEGIERSRILFSQIPPQWQ